MDVAQLCAHDDELGITELATVIGYGMLTDEGAKALASRINNTLDAKPHLISVLAERVAVPQGDLPLGAALDIPVLEFMQGLLLERTTPKSSVAVAQAAIGKPCHQSFSSDCLPC